MGIDRLGKNGPPVPVPPAEGTSAANPSAGAFQVPKAAPAPAVAGPPLDPTQAPGSTTGAALSRLRAGEVDAAGYADLKVEEATRHLSFLPPVQLEAIRTTLREQLANDPSLVELLHTATGEPPLPRDD
jgi:hypothetical protein